MTAVISNASPLIGLCKIDLLYVLKELWREVTIPEAVYREVVVDGKGKPGSNVIENACKDWIKVVAVKNRHEVEALQAILDKGESEVIALGQELKADLLLLDNKEPRLFAKGIDLDVIGTVGIIRLAWEKELIEDPVKQIHHLRLNGFWIHDEIVEQFKKGIK